MQFARFAALRESTGTPGPWSTSRAKTSATLRSGGTSNGSASKRSNSACSASSGRASVGVHVASDGEHVVAALDLVEDAP